jgi:Calcineurin-like phosphoesterase
MLAIPGSPTGASELSPQTGFTFSIAADMRYFTGPGTYDTSGYFRGAVEAIHMLGSGALLLSPGDFDPPWQAYWTITHTLGITTTWYPVIGNHELPGAGVESGLGANLSWLNGYAYGPVNPGPASCPKTTYSFDYQIAHFVVLNEYCDVASDHATDGDILDVLYNWLASDLSATQKALVFVIGHEPAYPQPDADNGRLRHLGDSLDKYPARRDRFWNLLKQRGVTAYICGHTHNYSVVQIGGVWQVDAGHARGLGDPGADSTFLVVQVEPSRVLYQTYRDDGHGGSYSLRHSGVLWPAYSLFLPVMNVP